MAKHSKWPRRKGDGRPILLLPPSAPLRGPGGRALQEAAIEMADLTPEEQVRWVLQFAREDLSHLSATERVARGYRLRVLGQPLHPVAIEGACEPMPEARLRELQADIATGLRTLLTEGKWGLPDITYHSPELDHVPSRGKRPAKLSLTSCGREPEVILHQVAALVLFCGSPLKACARCQRPFLPNKRQIYCSLACSQAVRTKSYRERNRDDFLAYRRRAYKRRQEKLRRKVRRGARSKAALQHLDGAVRNLS